MWAVALQQAVLVLVFMIYPVAAAQAIGLSPEQTASLVAATLIAVALATFLQSRRPLWAAAPLLSRSPRR
jgi:xanthine/uracil permease